jgi:ubiquitin-protein ligase
VVETIRFLLNSPNPDDPLNATASKQWKRDRDGFMDQVKDYVHKYAHWNQEY